MTSSNPVPTCSFCGRTEDQVQTLLAGPGVFICDACVDRCSAILRAPPSAKDLQEVEDFVRASCCVCRRWLRAIDTVFIKSSNARICNDCIEKVRTLAPR
ncbi:MAG TPA: ClpX C4-type zinc finger protein [Candidatus Binatia bacterium]|jgi:hypothetical protein